MARLMAEVDTEDCIDGTGDDDKTCNDRALRWADFMAAGTRSARNVTPRQNDGNNASPSGRPQIIMSGKSVSPEGEQ